jgi:ABC-type transport system substrate-binding protein
MSVRRTFGNRSQPRGAWPAAPLRLLLLTSVLALVAAACSFQDPEGGEGGEQGDTTFDIAIGIEPDTLDPIAQTTTTVQNILDYTVETLVKMDADAKLQPGLATEWEMAPDGSSYTFTLRDGVTFHDGTPFNAEAVKFNVERILNPDYTVPQRAAFTPIESVEVVDDTHVTFNLSRPSPILPDAFSQTIAGMISPDSANKQGNKPDAIVHPVGTGPYQFDSYKRGDRVTVKKYADYWGDKPHYETVNIRIVPEAATRESMVRSGQADMIILPPVSDLEALQNDENLEVILSDSWRSIFVAINNNEIKDPRVRQALNYAVNKQEMIDTLLFGAATQMDSPLTPRLKGYCKVGTYDYDPDRAKQMLQQAGVTSLNITMGTPSGRYMQDQEFAQAIVGYLKEVGVTAKLQTMEWPTYVEAITAAPDQQQFQAHVLGWSPSFPDASQQFDEFRKEAHPPEGLATSFYTNPQAQKLIDQGDVELNPERREQLYCEAAKIVWQDAPWIFLWTQNFPIVYSADVTGVNDLPNEKFDAVYARPADN